MTFKMGCNFFWLVLDLRELLGVILINNYITSNKILYFILAVIWLCHNILKLFFIIYACETISTKVFSIQASKIISNFTWFSWIKRIIQILFCIFRFQANATGNLINKMSYSICDGEARENVSLNISLCKAVKTNHNLNLTKNKTINMYIKINLLY